MATAKSPPKKASRAGRPRKRTAALNEKAPPRAKEVVQYITALKKQAEFFFRSIARGATDFLQFIRVVEVSTGISTDSSARGPRIFNVLLRFTEGVAVDTSCARTIRAAAVVFADKGLEEARVEDILKEANISPRTFYQFFRNKNDVFSALSELVLDVWFGLIQLQADQGLPVRTRISNMVRTYIFGFQVLDRLARVHLVEALRPDTESHKRFAQTRTKLVESLLKAYHDAGFTNVDDMWIRIRLHAMLASGIEMGVDFKTATKDFKRIHGELIELMMPLPPDSGK